MIYMGISSYIGDQVGRQDKMGNCLGKPLFIFMLFTFPARRLDGANMNQFTSLPTRATILITVTPPTPL